MSEAAEPTSSELPWGMEVAPGVHAPPKALRFQFSRSGGPGGQNVNKLNTKAELWVRADLLQGLAPDALGRLLALAGKRLTRSGEIHFTAETSRRQEANRQAVLDQLRQLLVQAMRRPKSRRRTRPTAASRQRRLTGKKRRSQLKSGRRPAAEE